MIFHKSVNISFDGKAGLFNTSVVNLNKKCSRPFQFRNNIFHLIENQHFNFNVGFFLPVISEIKYKDKI